MPGAEAGLGTLDRLGRPVRRSSVLTLPVRKLLVREVGARLPGSHGNDKIDRKAVTFIRTAYSRGEHLANERAIAEDIAGRYGLSPRRLRPSPEKTFAAVMTRRLGPGRKRDWMLLMAIPDPEFLTALEHSATLLKEQVDAKRARELCERIDGILATHGLPYRQRDGTLKFEWVGDPAIQDVAIGPAIAALADSRLAGARQEFTAALKKRRDGDITSSKDAIREAANAVESTLKVLLRARNIREPHPGGPTAFFNVLVESGVVPRPIEGIVLGPSRVRNRYGGHGQGIEIVAVPEALVDATVAAAAVAITLLATFLR